MEFLASLFVAKPHIVALVALVFVAGYLVLRYMVPGIARRPGTLLIASTAWGLYAAWEWLVLIRTPEANIRVDLLVLWPLLAVLSIWALYRAFR